MEGFYWECRPDVEALFLGYLEIFRKKNSFIADFEDRLLRNTSSRILDWIDHILVTDSGDTRERLDDLGFKGREDPDTCAFYHPGVLLPDIVLIENSAGNDPGIALCVESIESFLQANGFAGEIEGPAFSSYRRACLSRQNSTTLWAVERRGTRRHDSANPKDAYFKQYSRGVESWKNLPRGGSDEETVFREMYRTAVNLAANLGTGMAAHIVLQCEREYWLSRNAAGRAQKNRQDKLGVGWANHDHHTFRSSRRNFSKLINLFLQLGFQKRERFYAGAEAGWGAQVMEHPEAPLSLFLDVDLTPQEVDIDFSECALQDLETLGTVGLWCALHGDSILNAGMHHLAARFDFDRLIRDTVEHDIRFMDPFSNFTYLKQAFTVAEIWQVEANRVRPLIHQKHIREKEGEQFLSRGSVGSHLENIERREGYKGFNRKNVSAIIRDTDPRKA